MGSSKAASGRIGTQSEPAQSAMRRPPSSTADYGSMASAGFGSPTASVIPSIPSDPTAATVYAVAERAADLIASG